MESSKMDTELPSQMANLDIIEMEETSPDMSPENLELPAQQTRVLRKRKSLAAIDSCKPSNRRVNMKPRKCAISENANPKQIEALYLNKTIKRNVSQTLETIYEEPKTDNGTNSHGTPSCLIGSRKVKRLLTFQLGNQYTKEKIKKRRAKIKKLLGNKSFLSRKKIPMQVFLKTIECLELDETVQTDKLTPS